MRVCSWASAWEPTRARPKIIAAVIALLACGWAPPRHTEHTGAGGGFSGAGGGAAGGHGHAAAPSAASNSRRPMVTVMRPSRAKVRKGNDTTPRACCPNSAHLARARRAPSRTVNATAPCRMRVKLNRRQSVRIAGDPSRRPPPAGCDQVLEVQNRLLDLPQADHGVARKRIIVVHATSPAPHSVRSVSLMLGHASAKHFQYALNFCRSAIAASVRWP